MNHDWKTIGDKYYYYNTFTGKIIGFSHKHALSDVWYSLVYTGEYTFTIDEEKHLGQYINSDSAKKAVEFYWDVSNRTLIENN